MAAAPATMPPAAVAAGMRMTFPGARRGEGGKLLGQLRRTAMRTRRPLPVAGADEDFAVAFALLAMKLVNRHGKKIAGAAEILKRWQPR